MNEIGRSKVSLRLFGDTLSPGEVTQALGVAPTYADIKGERVAYPPNATHLAKRGSWRLQASTREPEDLNSQIAEIFSKLTGDVNTWRQLTSMYDADLFCGIFLRTVNGGLTISADSMRILSERGIKLNLDIYEREGDERDSDHA